MTSDVQICRMTFGITMHRWLCVACRAARKAAGWTVEIAKTTALHALECDDCEMARQAAEQVANA
jgi:hypothetical protein